jgi:uncharacterized membrane protein YeaQ/YmgE (transglycosylase-associated protein family)
MAKLARIVYLIWNALVAGLIGSAAGGAIITSFFYVHFIVQGNSLNILPNLLGLTFMVFMFSAIYTLPCAMLILLPLALILGKFVERGWGMALLALLAAIGGALVIVALDALSSSSHRDVLPAALLSFLFSLPASLAFSRAIRRKLAE